MIATVVTLCVFDLHLSTELSDVLEALDVAVRKYKYSDLHSIHTPTGVQIRRATHYNRQLAVYDALPSDQGRVREV